MPSLVLPSDLADYQAGEAQAFIDAATALVRSYCGWHIAPSVEETVTLDGSGSSLLPLPSLHVTAVASVTEDGTALTEDDYRWSASGWLRKTCGCWTGKERGVEVTFTHGFDEAPDVAGVVMAVASRGQVSPRGEVRQQAGPFATTFSQFDAGQGGGIVLLRPEMATLDRYRLPGRP